MKISTTQFDYTYYHSVKAGNNIHGEYVIHTIDVYNYIIIDDLKLFANYQTGMSFNYNQYSCPCPELELSEAGGTETVLIKVNGLYESDFDNDQFINEKLVEIMELCPAICDTEKLFRVYEALNDNKPNLSDFLDPEKYTDNFDDYVEDLTGFLTLKAKAFQQAEEHNDKQ